MRSEVLLITDYPAMPTSRNKSTGNGLYTIAVGSGQLNQLNLPYLPNNSDIQPGDLLITSGLGGTFPQGYPVATVKTVTSQPDKPFAIITATPKAQLDRIRELLVVWSDSTPIPLLNPSKTPTPQSNEPD
jgi:rod shape-determining protein MreC